jgi:anti-sigma B factor antagonist
LENIPFTIFDHPENKDITLLSVKGPIDTITAPQFGEKLHSLLEDKKFKLIVDLKDVDYINSSGWGFLMKEVKHIRSQNGDLVLAGMNPHVEEVFGYLEFNGIVKAFPNVESAVKMGFRN